MFNSWERMPAVEAQMAIPESATVPTLRAARFLLKPGRRYEQAVKRFEPYTEIKEADPSARAAGAALIRAGLATAGATMVYVNNRLEGNALQTINAMLELAGQ